MMTPRSTRSENLSSLPLRPVSGKGRREAKKITDDDFTEPSGSLHIWEASSAQSLQRREPASALSTPCSAKTFKTTKLYMVVHLRGKAAGDQGQLGLYKSLSQKTKPIQKQIVLFKKQNKKANNNNEKILALSLFHYSSNDQSLRAFRLSNHCRH